MTKLNYAPVIKTEVGPECFCLVPKLFLGIYFQDLIG